jgi:hypothetical protein
VEENLLKCGQQGLTGTLSIEGIGESYSAALVRVHWHDGVTRVHTITTSQPLARLFGSSVDNRTAVEIGGAYLMLGVEHILAGIDHRLFVIALLFLVGFNRQLVWTITAFTAAHSITLALSALDLLTLRSAPVEAAIALSIVLVTVEALHRRDTLSRRWPALVAFMFGLVHGLGFAGALREIGLPETHVSAALLAFNLGVEAGQLAVVGLALLAWWIGRRQPALLHARTPALYGIGALASWWSIDRSIAVSLMPVTPGNGPLVCDAGSKPESRGEYGNIHADCVVSTGPLAEGEKSFSVKVVWSHAVFKGVEMIREVKP